jgi:hypothetical protein
MAINFPNTPIDQETYTENGITYIYSSAKGVWNIVQQTVAIVSANTQNNQILFKSNSEISGSNGMIYLPESNTVSVNNVDVTLNVTAQYFYGNGAFLQGISGDLGPAFGQANTARTHANTAHLTANAAFDKANSALPNTSGISFNGSLNFPSGNVNIGTDSPLTLFQVSTGYDAAAAGKYPSIVSRGGYGGGIGFYDSPVMSGIYAKDTGSKLVFFVGQTASDSATSKEKMFIDTNGNVVIGRTDSTVGQDVKLDVAGAINASAVLVNGTPLTSGTGGGSLNVATDVVNATRYLMFANGVSGSVPTLNVATGLTFNPSSNTLDINGPINAITKSFVINHPTKPDMKLRYGSLEGPENGVYVRGRLYGQSIIELPEYWWNLIDEETITVNLTPIGYSQDLWVQSTSSHFIHLNQPAECFFTVFAERKDVDKLVVEYW